MRSAVQSCDPLRKTSTCDSPQVLFSICSSVDVISSTADQVSGRRFRFFSGQRFSEDKRGILGQGGRNFSCHVRIKTFSAHVKLKIDVTCVNRPVLRTSPCKTFCPKKTSYVKQSSYCAEPPPGGWSYEHLRVSIPHILVFRPPCRTAFFDLVTQIQLTTSAGRNGLTK